MAIKLSDYLQGMAAAQTADELEAALQRPFKHAFHGRTWAAICRARIEAGNRICQAHPNGQFVPHLGARRLLTVCGETYRVGNGQNSTGVRYCWHAAGQWAKGLLRSKGFSTRAAHQIWEGFAGYPHRTLAVVEKALAGGIPDPLLNTLLKHKDRSAHGKPINYSVEQNQRDLSDRRATRPCACGGVLFDWGGGWSEGFDFINWHCNACPDVFTEYMTKEQFYTLRQTGAAPAPSPLEAA